jgi:hypothetical protein
MRRIAAAALALGLLAGCGGGGHAKATTTPRCEEDMACWKCDTMGNKVCGPQHTEDNAWVCWDEVNTEMPDGTERICGPLWASDPAIRVAWAQSQH